MAHSGAVREPDTLRVLIAPLPGGIGLGLVIGGARGNLYDRLVRGSVVDFIAIRGWSTFNPADSLMVGGTLLAAWSIL